MKAVLLAAAAMLAVSAAQAQERRCTDYAGLPEDTGPAAGMVWIAGGHFTMGPTEAAHAARLLKVQSVVPMHYGTFGLLKGTPDELTAELKKVRAPAKVVRLDAGKATPL